MNDDVRESRSEPILNTLRLSGSIWIALGVMLFALAVIPNSGCSHPTLTVDKTSPVAFGLSGSEDVQFFQIATADAVVWRIGPKQSQSLSAIGRVVYGEIPASCLQTIPKTGSPPRLEEGTLYRATAVIFDSAPVVIRFSVTGNSVVQPK